MVHLASLFPFIYKAVRAVLNSHTWLDLRWVSVIIQFKDEDDSSILTFPSDWYSVAQNLIQPYSLAIDIGKKSYPAAPFGRPPVSSSTKTVKAVLSTDTVHSQAWVFRTAAHIFRVPTQQFLQGRKGFRAKKCKRTAPSRIRNMDLRISCIWLQSHALPLS